MHVNAVGLIEFGFQSWSAQPTCPFLSRSRHPHHAISREHIFADQMILRIGNDDIPGTVKAQVFRSVQ